jgi:hypothetical protein
MLKFIRKYQLIMLAIGGSLLMVVFLVGPVIQQIGPTLANKSVATLANGHEITVMDRSQAVGEIQLISQVFPFMFGNTEEGSRGLINLEDNLDHWLLLTYEADQAGLIGEFEDGRTWIDQELAQIYAYTEKQYALYQQIPYMPFVNQQMSQPSVQQEIAERAIEVRSVLPARVHQVALSRGVDDSVIYKMLAKARGVLRMIGRHDRSIRQSDRDIIKAVREVFDSAITDYAYIPASVLINEDEMPSDEKLAAQFEAFKDTVPGEGDLGYGYTLPARVKLGWITIDHDSVAASIEPDRIEMHKRWAENRDRFVGDYADERDKVREEIINEEVADLMIEADRIIAGRLRAVLRDVPKNGAYYEIPHNWGAVTMEILSQAVVDDIKDQRGIDFPMPAITYRVEKWFTEAELQELAGIGGSYWQIGPDRIAVPSIPTLARELGGSPRIAIQVRVPVVDPYAKDDQGNHYYVVLFNTREQSPPDSWDEIKDQLVKDVREYEAYQTLTGQLEGLKALAMDEGGFEEIAARFNPPDQSESEEVIDANAERISPSQWATITRNTISRLDPSKTVDTRANLPPFREAVMDLAESLDPMADFGSLPRSSTVLTLKLPAQKAVAVANILAYRPATKDRRYSLSPRDIAVLSTREYSEIESDAPYPFTLEGLKTRLGFKVRKSKGDDEEDM